MRAILFHLPFGIPLYSYGLMLTVSVITGRLLALRLAERAGIDTKVATAFCRIHDIRLVHVAVHRGGDVRSRVGPAVRAAAQTRRAPRSAPNV